MIQLKPGVTLLGLQPQLVLAAMAAMGAYAKRNTDLVITSGNEGKHSHSSAHYAGMALDFRTHSLPRPEDGPAIASELQAALGRDFDVLYEGDHIHVEWDPKRPQEA